MLEGWIAAAVICLASALVAVRDLGAKRSFGNVYNQAALPMLPFEWKK